MNSGNYDFLAVRMLAKDIVDNIGVSTFYSTENKTYLNAPKCSLLRRVDGFEEYVLKCFSNSGDPIHIHNLRYDMGAGLSGMYIRKLQEHYIFINSKINLCWNRFARLKELCSVYVDHYQFTNTPTDFLSSLDNAYFQKDFINGMGNLDEGDLDSETFAILLASELMIPIHERDLIGGYFEQIENKTLTFNDLAKSLLMPEYILRLYHDKRLLNKPPLYTDFN